MKLVHTKLQKAVTAGVRSDVADAKAELQQALATPDYKPVYRTRLLYEQTLAEAEAALNEGADETPAGALGTATGPAGAPGAATAPAGAPADTATAPPAGWEAMLVSSMQQMQRMQEQAMAEIVERSAAAAREAAKEVMQQHAPVQRTTEVAPQTPFDAPLGMLQHLGSTSSPACTSSEHQSVATSSAGSSAQRTTLEKQLLELQGQQAYEEEMMRQKQAARNAEIARLQHMMRNS